MNLTTYFKSYVRPVERTNPTFALLLIQTIMTYKTKWSIDHAHSEIAFKVRHLMIAHVKGIFSTYNAHIYTSNNDFTTAKIDLWIDVDSINTGDKKRDVHLKSDEFFDIKNHKQIQFVSSSIKKTDVKDNYELRGMLSIKGFPQEVVLNVEFGGIAIDPWGNEKAGFLVTGTINKIAWGLGWNKPLTSGGFMLSEDVIISCEMELTNAGIKEVTKVAEPDFE